MKELNIYIDLVYGKKNIKDETFANIPHENCYLALRAALERDLVRSRKFLVNAPELEQPEMECFVRLETRALLSYFSGDFSDAKSFAVKALEMEEKAFYARSLLARFAGWEKNFTAQIEQYEIVLKFYPEHSNTLLDLAQAILSGKGIYQIAIKQVLKAKASFRRFMYILLIPLGLPLIRLALAVLFLFLFSAPVTGNMLFVILSLLTLVGFILSIIKLRWDSLIISRLFVFQFIATVSWILSQFI